MVAMVDSYRFLDGVAKRVMQHWSSLRTATPIPWTPLAKPLSQCANYLQYLEAATAVLGNAELRQTLPSTIALACLILGNIYRGVRRFHLHPPAMGNRSHRQSRTGAASASST